MYLAHEQKRSRPVPALHAHTIEEGADTVGLRARWAHDRFADLPTDLLEHKGAGPHGAAWNPSGELVVAASVDIGSGTPPEEMRLYIEGKEMKGTWKSIDASYQLVLCHFVVPEQAWMAALRDVRRSDIWKLYADRPETLEAWKQAEKSGDSSLVGIPLVVGEMALVEVRFVWEGGYQESQTGYLHCAFGE
jgi:hypothetical protein